jgi:hypothetical protein
MTVDLVSLPLTTPKIVLIGLEIGFSSERG